MAKKRIRVAINGFRRIGRAAFKIMLKKNKYEVVAINDLASADSLAYLLKHDTVYGLYPKKVLAKGNDIYVNGKKYQITAVPEPKSEYVTGNAREVELVRHYLTQTYLIKDQFDSDHAARRIFFDEVIRSEPAVAMWVKNHSKLKGNRVTTEVYYPMVLITENLQEHFPQKGRSLNEIHQSHQFLIGPQYDVLSFEEKIAYNCKGCDRGKPAWNMISKAIY